MNPTIANETLNDDLLWSAPAVDATADQFDRPPLAPAGTYTIKFDLADNAERAWLDREKFLAGGYTEAQIAKIEATLESSFGAHKGAVKAFLGGANPERGGAKAVELGIFLRAAIYAPGEAWAGQRVEVEGVQGNFYSTMVGKNGTSQVNSFLRYFFGDPRSGVDSFRRVKELYDLVAAGQANYLLGEGDWVAYENLGDANKDEKGNYIRPKILLKGMTRFSPNPDINSPLYHKGCRYLAADEVNGKPAITRFVVTQLRPLPKQ